MVYPLPLQPSKRNVQQQLIEQVDLYSFMQQLGASHQAAFFRGSKSWSSRHPGTLDLVWGIGFLRHPETKDKINEIGFGLYQVHVFVLCAGMAVAPERETTQDQLQQPGVVVAESGGLQTSAALASAIMQEGG